MKDLVGSKQQVKKVKREHRRNLSLSEAAKSEKQKRFSPKCNFSLFQRFLLLY